MDESVERRFLRIWDLVAEVLKLPRPDRLPLLRQRLADDPSDLAAAEPLLRQAEAARGQVETPAPTVSAPPPQGGTPAGDVEVGDHVGPYVIQRHLGAGTYGDVWLANRRDLPKLVALKVIKLGMDSREVLARFELERQALALMNHTGIAQFYDAGVTQEGRPYFAMEHVPGVSVTEHCNRQRLGIEERLELFILICEAVQHAHQKGIIHRDLKPGNILVAYEGERAVPKVIDFGVAKALDQRHAATPLFTEDGRSIGTTPYMSPEQATTDPQGIDTRSDVYSLGVLLYQLLTGLHPFEYHGLTRDDLIRLIHHVEPATPSSRLRAFAEKDAESVREIARQRRTDKGTLVGSLRGDLDWIAMKCLEKDRSRRYQTVGELAEDLRSHLSFEPIKASRPSLTYRARKFVRRNRGAVVSATLIGGVVVAALIGVGRLEVRNRITEREKGRLVVERKLADDRVDARRRLALARSLFLQVADADRPGFDEDRIEDPASRQRANRELRAMLEAATRLDRDFVEAEILLIQSFVQEEDRTSATTHARDTAKRHPDSNDALATLAGLLDEGPERESFEQLLLQRGVREDLLLYHRALANSDPCEAIELLTQCLAVQPWHFDAVWQRAIRYQAESNHAGMLVDATLLTQVRPESALGWSLRGTALLELRRRPEAIESYSERLRIDDTHWRAHYDRAVAFHRSKRYDRALEDLFAAGERAPDNGEVHALRGAVLYKKEDKVGAIREFDQAIRLGVDYWWVYSDRGETHRTLGQCNQALADFDAALPRMEGFSDETIARVRRNRGTVLRELGRLDEALADLQVARDLRPDDVRTHAELGRVHLIAGRFDEALRSYDAALQMDPQGDADLERGVVLWFAGDADGARQALERWAGKPEYHWLYLWIWDLEASRGRRTEADAALQAAERANPGSDPPFTQAIRVLRKQVRPVEAEQSAADDDECLYTLYILGALARIEGRRQEAAELYRRALDLGRVKALEHDIVVHQDRAL